MYHALFSSFRAAGYGCSGVLTCYNNFLAGIPNLLNIFIGRFAVGDDDIELTEGNAVKDRADIPFGVIH